MRSFPQSNDGNENSGKLTDNKNKILNLYLYLSLSCTLFASTFICDQYVYSSLSVSCIRFINGIHFWYLSFPPTAENLPIKRVSWYVNEFGSTSFIYNSCIVPRSTHFIHLFLLEGQDQPLEGMRSRVLNKILDKALSIK